MLRRACVVFGIVVGLGACRGAERAETHAGTRPGPSAPPQRVISLGPSTTEILEALGIGDRLVGRSAWDRQPPSVLRVPEVGDALRPSIERLLALQPDVVVLYDSPDNRGASAALQAAGVSVVALRIDRIDQFLDAVDSLGRLVGREHAATDLRRRLEASLDSARQLGATLARPPTVFIPVSGEDMTVGRGSFLSELVQIAGGRNVYDDVEQSAFTISLEDVFRRDPEVILAHPTSVERLTGDARWRTVAAVRNGHVYAFDTVLVSQPSLCMGEAARSVHTSLAAAVSGRR